MLESRDDDRLLLARCLAGEAGAWEAFVRRFSPVLLRVCRRVLAGSGREAGDALQELFVHILDQDGRALRAWRGEASLEGYLCALAAYRALRVRRGPPRALPIPEPAGGESPVDALMAEEGRERLRGEMDRLPVRTRLALGLQADGASIREVAGVLGVTEAAAAHLLSRAKAGLRERLGRPPGVD